MPVNKKYPKSKTRDMEKKPTNEAMVPYDKKSANSTKQLGRGTTVKYANASGSIPNKNPAGKK